MSDLVGILEDTFSHVAARFKGYPQLMLLCRTDEITKDLPYLSGLLFFYIYEISPFPIMIKGAKSYFYALPA